jgi:hypothetical protein
MSDDADLAGDRLEREMEAAMQAVQRRAAVDAMKPLPVLCLNGCGHTPTERGRYCSSECREDHESRLARAKRMGAR